MLDATATVVVDGGTVTSEEASLWRLVTAAEQTASVTPVLCGPFCSLGTCYYSLRFRFKILSHYFPFPP